MASDYSEYFRLLYERVPEAVHIPFRQVCLGDWEPVASKCHENVDHWVRQDPESTAVRGWIFWPPDESGHCHFMAHSVIEEHGELADITPIDPNTPREALVFLRHLGTEAEFDLLKTNYAGVTYPFPTWEQFQANHSPETDEATDIDF